MKLIKELYVPIDTRFSLTPIFAKQCDHDSRFFKIHITRCGEVVAAEEWTNITLVAICITRSDGESKAFEGEYNSQENAFELPLPLWAVEVCGDKSSFDVMIQYEKEGGGEAVLRSALVPLTIQKSAYKATDVSDDEVDLLTALIKDTRELKNSVSTAEAARVVAEQGRANAEAQRVKNEATRASAENSRANAEATRVSNESARASAEQGRATAEQGRVAGYNAIMTELGESIDNINNAAKDAESVRQIAAKMQMTFFYDEAGRPCYMRKVNEEE